MSFSPDEPRDTDGKWTDGQGGGKKSGKPAHHGSLERAPLVDRLQVQIRDLTSAHAQATADLKKNPNQETRDYAIRLDNMRRHAIGDLEALGATHGLTVVHGPDGSGRSQLRPTDPGASKYAAMRSFLAHVKNK